MEKKLYRDDMHKVIAGVCSGLADYFGIDIAIVRLVFLLTLILKGGGVLVYIVLWIVLPKKPYYLHQPNQQSPIVDYTVPPVTSAAPQWDSNMGNVYKKRSTGGIIAGTVLVLLGGCFLLDDLDIIPDWDMEHLWPLILIGVGIVVIFAGSKKEPWEKEGWNKTEGPSKSDPSTDNSLNDNPPTV
jgi:phage shock protein PspC (stress-responsive transcriptional regulator)